MPYKQVAALIERGQLEEATRVCLDDHAMDMDSMAKLPPEIRENLRRFIESQPENSARMHAEELLWIAALATLFGVGKGSAWGSGRCRLAEAIPADILLIK